MRLVVTQILNILYSQTETGNYPRLPDGSMLALMRLIMKPLLRQGNKHLSTHGFGNYPYSSGVTVVTQVGTQITEKDFTTEINHNGILPVDQYIVDQFLEIGFTAWLCRKGKRYYLTAIDPSFVKYKWDEFCLAIDGDKDLAWELKDGDQYLFDVDKFPSSDFLKKQCQKHRYWQIIATFFGLITCHYCGKTSCNADCVDYETFVEEVNNLSEEEIETIQQSNTYVVLNCDTRFSSFDPHNHNTN